MLAKIEYKKLYSKNFIKKYNEIDSLVNALNTQIGLPLYQTRIDMNNKEIVVEDYFENLTNTAYEQYNIKKIKKSFRGIYG